MVQKGEWKTGTGWVESLDYAYNQCILCLYWQWNTSKRQCIFIVIFFLALLCLVQLHTEVLLAAVSGRKSYPLHQEQSLSLSCALFQIYHNKTLQAHLFLHACVFMASDERHGPQDALHVRPDPSLPVACLFHPDTWHAAPCQSQLKHVITLLAEGYLHAVVDVSMTDVCCSIHNSVEMLHYSISAS